MKVASRIAVLLIALPFFSLANDESVDKVYQENYQLWSKYKHNNYQYTLNRQCFCPIEYTRAVRIDVRDNQVTQAKFIDDNQPVSNNLFKDLETIDDWFLLISSAIDRRADHISLQFDEEYGYPQLIDIDMRLLRSDDEHVISISNLTLK